MFVDGACKGNPGPGGWGVLLRHGEIRKQLYGGEVLTTNNRMELTAVIKGFEALKKPSHVMVITDSKYVLQGMVKWLAAWKKRGWKTASRQPVKNQDLWMQLDALAQRHEVRWQWVKGHSGHQGNEQADGLANRGIEELSGAQPG